MKNLAYILGVNKGNLSFCQEDAKLMADRLIKYNYNILLPAVENIDTFKQSFSGFLTEESEQWIFYFSGELFLHKKEIHLGVNPNVNKPSQNISLTYIINELISKKGKRGLIILDCSNVRVLSGYLNSQAMEDHITILASLDISENEKESIEYSASKFTFFLSQALGIGQRLVSNEKGEITASKILDFLTSVSTSYAQKGKSTFKRPVLFEPSGSNFVLAKSLIQYSTDPYETIRARDWDDKPENYHLFGRDGDITALTNQLNNSDINVIFVWGMYGIGKTDLVSKFCDTIENQFDYIFWRRLNDRLDYITFLQELQKHITNNNDTLFENDPIKFTNKIIAYLKEKRVLIILDNYDTILNSSGSGYQDGYNNYGFFLQLFSRKKHQSKLVITSRSVPEDIAKLEGKSLKLYPLDGIDSDACFRIFKETGEFEPDPEDLKIVVDYYKGNPFLIEHLAKLVKNGYAKNLGVFIKKRYLSQFEDAIKMIDWHFQKCTAEEQTILFWLAINREPTSIEDLTEDLVEPHLIENIPQLIKSIKDKINVGRTENGSLFLQQVILDILTDKFTAQVHTALALNGKDLKKIIDTALVGKVFKEIKSLKFDILNTHCLLKASSNKVVQTAQINTLIDPVIYRLSSHYGSKEMFLIELKKIINLAHINFKNRKGYLMGNLINLYNRLSETADTIGNLQKIFPKLSLEQCAIWQADLSKCSFHDVSFKQSHFKKCRFLETFGNVLSIAYEESQNELYTADDSGKIIIWDNESLVRKDILLPGHSDWVRSLAVSHSGLRLISGSDDLSVKIWDLSSRQLVHDSRPHLGWVWVVKFHPESDNIFASGSEDGTIQVQDIGDNTATTFKGHSARVRDLLFVRGKNEIISCDESGSVLLWDYKKNQKIHAFNDHTDAVRTLDISIDQKYLISAGNEGVVKIWDLVELKLLDSLPKQLGKIRSLKFSPKFSNIFAAAGDDKVIRLWNIETKICVKALTGHRDWIMALIFINNGENIVSGGVSQELKYWNVRYDKCYKEYKGYYNPCVKAIIVKLDGAVLIIGCYENGEIVIFEKDHPDKPIIKVSDNPLLALGYNEKANCLLTGDNIGNIFKIHIGKELKTSPLLRKSEGRVRAIIYDNKNDLTYSAGLDGVVNAWQDTKFVQTIVNVGFEVWTIAYNAEKGLLFIGGESNAIEMFDVKNSKSLKPLLGHELWVWSVKSVNKNEVMSCGGDGQIILWNILDNKIIRKIKLFTQIWDIDYSESEGIIIAACADGTIRGIDYFTFTQTSSVYKGHLNQVRTVCFIDHSQFISSSDDSKIILWDIKYNHPIKEFIRERPYERSSFQNCVGLNSGEINNLKLLGAIV